MLWMSVPACVCVKLVLGLSPSTMLYRQSPFTALNSPSRKLITSTILYVTFCWHIPFDADQISSMGLGSGWDGAIQTAV
jgi:hypothetical protein